MAKRNNTLKIILIGGSILLLVLGSASAIKSCSDLNDMPNINDVLPNSSEDKLSSDNSQVEPPSSEDVNNDNGSSENQPTHDNTSSEDNGSNDNTSSEQEFISQHHFTIVGSMNEWDVSNNDYLFTTTDDIIFTLNCDLPYLSEWKIINNNGWDWQYGSENLSSGNTLNFVEASGENIKTKTSGNYDITLNISNHTISLSYIGSI